MGFADLVTRADRAAQEHLGGVTVTYAPEVGDSVEVTGIFDERFVLVESGEAGVEQVTPAVWLRLEDLPAHPDDDNPTVTISGQAYEVRGRQYDGVGGSVLLFLHAVSA